MFRLRAGSRLGGRCDLEALIVFVGSPRRKSFTNLPSGVYSIMWHTHRVAISNHRIVNLADGKVTFRWKDYAHKNKKRC
jgi:hypothetical protein